MVYRVLAALFGMVSASTAATAVTVQWADLQTRNPLQITGTIAVGMVNVGLTVSLPDGFWGAQTVPGTDFWVDRGYTNGVVNRPVGTDIIQLGTGGLKTITFDRAVTDPFLAFSSWQANRVSFSSPYTIVSQGCGYWGCGTFQANGPGSFIGNGEVHGVLRFAGTFTSLSFTDTTEAWHGFTVGIEDIAAVGGVPEPASWAMMIGGFGMIGAAMRRRAAVTTLA